MLVCIKETRAPPVLGSASISGSSNVLWLLLAQKIRAQSSWRLLGLFLPWLHIVPADYVLQKGEYLVLHLRELVGLTHVEEEMQR